MRKESLCTLVIFTFHNHLGRECPGFLLQRQICKGTCFVLQCQISVDPFPVWFKPREIEDDFCTHGVLSIPVQPAGQRHSQKWRGIFEQEEKTPSNYLLIKENTAPTERRSVFTFLNLSCMSEIVRLFVLSCPIACQ